MQANRNTLDHIRFLAKRYGVRPPELLAMAREAEHSELMPGLEYMTAEGAARLKADLERIPETRLVMRQLSRRIAEAHQVTT